MIQSFGNKETEKIWEGKRSNSFPESIQEVARRKLRMLNNSFNIKDLTIPPSNRLEKLKGEWKQYYSIRINDQCRIAYSGEAGHPFRFLTDTFLKKNHRKSNLNYS